VILDLQDFPTLQGALVDHLCLVVLFLLAFLEVPLDLAIPDFLFPLWDHFLRQSLFDPEALQVQEVLCVLQLLFHQLVPVC